VIISTSKSQNSNPCQASIVVKYTSNIKIKTIIDKYPDCFFSKSGSLMAYYNSIPKNKNLFFIGNRLCIINNLQKVLSPNSVYVQTNDNNQIYGKMIRLKNNEFPEFIDIFITDDVTKLNSINYEIHSPIIFLDNVQNNQSSFRIIDEFCNTFNYTIECITYDNNKDESYCLKKEIGRAHV
jgi:hypothetical protein